MSRGRQHIQFEGYFAKSVLGIFRIIQGFADLWDLVAVSVPNEIPGRLKPEIIAILKDAGATIDGGDL